MRPYRWHRNQGGANGCRGTARVPSGLFVVCLLVSCLFSTPPSLLADVTVSSRTETAPYASLAQALSPCLPPPPQVRLFAQSGISVEYYDVPVRTLSEITPFMRSSGPQDEDGIRRDALLSWDISWRWEHRDRPLGDTVRVRSTTRLVLPRWCPGTFVPLHDQQEWLRYLLMVLEHEAGHATILLKHVAPFGTQLKQFFAHCSGCNATEGNRFGFSLLTHLSTEQSAYDDQTDHGASQHARLREPVNGGGRGSAQSDRTRIHLSLLREKKPSGRQDR
jgi:predicted secreted Zn-dependent protease